MYNNKITGVEDTINFCLERINLKKIREKIGEVCWGKGKESGI